MQHLWKKAAACLAVAALVISVPAEAQGAGQGASQGAKSPEKLRRLDIMLMVTSLRCRTTSSNFQSDFADFEAAHLGELNGAARDMKIEMLAEYGPRGVDRALDRVSTGMANQYGQGHPWLDCAELKSITRSLAMMRGPEALVEAADQLLSNDGRGEQLAWARR